MDIDDVKFRLAQNFWNWGYSYKRKRRERDFEKYEMGEDFRAGLLKWFDEHPAIAPVKILPEEVVPTDEWDVDGLVGQEEEQMMHPHYYELMKHVLKYPVKRHDVLIVFECSNKKPYTANNLFKFYFRMYDDVADFAVADYGLIPMAYAELYPYRYDEWDHFKESKYISWFYRQVAKCNLKNFLEAWGYKKVIVCMQSDLPQQFLTEVKEENWMGLGDMITIVTDRQFRKEYMDIYLPRFKNRGMAIMRTLNMNYTRRKLNLAVLDVLDELNLSHLHLDEYQDLLELVGDQGSVSKRAIGRFECLDRPSVSEFPYGTKLKKKNALKRKGLDRMILKVLKDEMPLGELLFKVYGLDNLAKDRSVWEAYYYLKQHIEESDRFRLDENRNVLLNKL